MITKIRLYIGVALASVPLLGSGQTHAATYSGMNGDIVYMQKQGQESVLSSMASDGSDKQLLDRSVQSVAWSPDGTRLAYLVGDRKCATRLKILHYATKRAKTVAHGGCIVGDVAWSPDGMQLALTRAKGLDRAVLTIKLAEGFERAVTGWKQGVKYQNPSWSPDALKLMYEKHTAHQGSLVTHRLGTHATRALTELSDPGVAAKASWSQSGKKILYRDSENEIYTIWPDGTHRAVISDGDSYDAVWSPDGSRMAFLEDLSGAAFNLTTTDGSVEYHDISHHGYVSARTPVWSPDAKKLLLVVGVGNSNRLVQIDLQTMQLHVLASSVVGTAGWQARQL